MKKHLVLRAAMAAVTLLLASRQAGAAPPTLRATRAAGAIQVDGALAEASWDAAPWCGGFSSASAGAENSGQPKPAAVQTRFRVLYDAEALYVGVECDEPKPEGIRAAAAEHDGMTFGDDCVEIFLDPEGEGRYYQHFAINSRGAWYDDFNADYGLVHGKLWDCPIQAAGSVDAANKRWTLEVKLPFGALVLGARPSTTWSWNVTRERYAGGAQELTSWAPLKGQFHAPRLFGKLAGVEAEYRRFALAVGEPAASVSGGGSGVRRIAVRTRVTNQTPAPQTLTARLSLFGKPDSAVSAPELVLKPGADAEVAFPALSVRENVPEAVCLLTFADAASGHVVKAVAKRLSAEYRPLAVEVLAPCYRNTLYATQKLESILFRVTPAADVVARAATLRWELRDESGEAVRQGSLPAAKLPERIAFPAAGLATGRYTLVAEALTAAGESIAKQEAPLRKLPPPQSGSEVRIDENRHLLVDGKPFLGIGWYGGVPTGDPRADVVALQNVQTPVNVMMPDVSPIRDAYRKHGIRSFVSVENGRLFYSFSLWRQQNSTVQKELAEQPTPSPEMIRLVRELIAAVRGEPGLLGYYIADEPEINNTRSDYLEALYRLLQEEDPYHPVMVTNDTLDGIVTHGYKCADILNPDPYSPAPDYVPNFAKKVLELARRGKATMLTLWHSSSQAHFTDEWGTAPAYPYRVFRGQYLAGVAYGAVGFTAYTSSFFLPEVQYRYGLPYVWRELRFLEKAMATPAPAVPLRVQPAETASWIRRAGGHVTLVLVNHKPGTRQVKVSHPWLAGVKHLLVASEGRQVAVQGGAFTDRLAEGDARIYTTDLAARSLKTTAAVEAELAQRERAAAKPGNLLHLSRGTRCLASEGYYAPWFYQYFYYAVNGITDDLGWCASHAGGKPAWLEVALKEPAAVGRLVLYSPNLKDCTVEMRAPDGAAARFQVQGNEATVIERRFRPAIPCLKIRVTVTAVRPGQPGYGDVPQISEIEAYADAGEGPATDVTRAAGAFVPTALPPAPPLPAGAANALWADEFRDLQVADRYLWNGQDTKWVRNPDQVRLQAKPEGGIGIACLSPSGAPVTHLFPYDPAYRYLQVNLKGITGEGYRFVNVGLGVSSGASGYRGGINTSRPGLYTVDTHAIHPDFATGRNKQCFLSLYTAGAQKQADGSVTPGPEFALGWIRLAHRPEDGLAVTLADGSPLPAVLKQGDELLFRLSLGAPAADATVEVKKSHEYSPLPINGEPYVQLGKVGSGDGRDWAARVKLGPGTGTFDVARSGYPVVFRAVITGGRIRETYASAFVSIE